MADYKKRKELKEYLPHDEHWKLKSEKSDRKSVDKTLPATQNSPNSTAEDTESKVPEEGTMKRKMVEEEEDQDQLDEDCGTEPTSKKCNYENGEKEPALNGDTAGRENGGGKGAAA